MSRPQQRLGPSAADSVGPYYRDEPNSVVFSVNVAATRPAQLYLTDQ